MPPLHDQSAQRSGMRDRDRILREWDLDKQCMHMLSPCCSVPLVDDGMHYEERRAGLSCWPRCRVKRKPPHRQSSHDVHGAKVADEMVIQSAGLANARNRRVPDGRG
jgi:hypothetical protein